MRISLRYSCLLALLLIAAVSSAPDSTQTCANTRSILESIKLPDQNGSPTSVLVGSIFDDLKEAHQCSLCPLKETCCSEDAENAFRNFIVEHYREKIISKLSLNLMGCHNHSFFDEFKQYIDGSRASLVQAMLQAYGIYFSQFVTIFDRFYGYLQSIVDTGNTCALATEWNEVFFQVYLAAYFSTPGIRRQDQLPATNAFRQCFYDIFLENEGNNIANSRNGFLRAFNQTMRYLRALRRMDQTIESVMDYLLRPECQSSIMKMTHCASCAGVVAPPCDNLCLNVLRGCMIDLSDLFEPMENFSQALLRLHESITTQNGLYYFWSQMDSLASNFFRMVNAGTSSAFTIQTQVLTRCNANGHIRAKRQLGGGGGHGRVARNVVLAPLNSLNQSAYCIAGAVSSLRAIPDNVCESVPTESTLCWNGNTIGSYGRAVFDFDRSSQINNPEMVVKHHNRQFGQEIANLAAATREIDIITGAYECGSDDEDEICNVPETCEFYSFIDAPYNGPKRGSMSENGSGLGSGSGSGSGDNYADSGSRLNCLVSTAPPTVETTIAPTTTPSEPSSTRIDVTTGRTLPSPNEESTTSDLGNVNTADIQVIGGATRLSCSLIVLLVSCCVFLLH